MLQKIKLKNEFLLLGPGILLANPERPCLQIDFFRKNGWEVIYCPKPVATDGENNLDMTIVLFT